MVHGSLNDLAIAKNASHWEMCVAKKELNITRKNFMSIIVPKITQIGE